MGDKPGSPWSRYWCPVLPVPVGTVHPAAAHLLPMDLTPKMSETLPIPTGDQPHTPPRGELVFFIPAGKFLVLPVTLRWEFGLCEGESGKIPENSSSSSPSTRLGCSSRSLLGSLVGGQRWDQSPQLHCSMSPAFICLFQGWLWLQTS